MSALRPGYKRTDVGVIPADWEAALLGKLATLKSGETITQRLIADVGAYPCYGGNGLRGYTTRHTHTGAYSLIGRQGALCGNVTYVSGKFFASEHAVVVDANKKIGPRLLYYLLTSYDLNSLSESSAQPGLAVEKLKLVPFALPSSEVEQDAIAEALGDADALIGALEALIAKKRDIKQGAMQELLTGQRLLPGFVADWVKTPLGDLGPWRGGATPSMRRPEFWDGGDIPWASSSDVRIGPVKSTVGSITDRALRESSTNLVPAQSILIVMRSGILRRFLPVGLAERSIAINQDIKALLPAAGVVSTFVFHSIVAASENILASCMKSGTTVESIELRWLKKFEIGIPPTANEQRAIAAVLSDMDAEIAALEEKLAKARAVKQGMMQVLLTGEVRLV